MDDAVTPLANADAPKLCHRLMTKAEFERFFSGPPLRPSTDALFRQPMRIEIGPEKIEQYPAFQLFASLDGEMFHKLREMFHANGCSELDVWNFLRTAQKTLGGMTAAEHLIGHHSVEVAQLSKRDQDEILLELAQEELWRLQQ